MEEDAAIDETTAEARGSSVVDDWSFDLDLDGDAWIALAVTARMAFCAFFVPKARPRLLRAERGYWSLVSVLKEIQI